MVLDAEESGLIKEDICFPLGVASAPPSRSGNSTSPFTCRALAAASVALIASASAADASTRYSTPLLVRLFKILHMNDKAKITIQYFTERYAQMMKADIPRSWE